MQSPWLFTAGWGQVGSNERLLPGGALWSLLQPLLPGGGDGPVRQAPRHHGSDSLQFIKLFVPPRFISRPHSQFIKHSYSQFIKHSSRILNVNIRNPLTQDLSGIFPNVLRLLVQRQLALPHLRLHGPADSQVGIIVQYTDKIQFVQPCPLSEWFGQYVTWISQA